jgi:hypothetical protein
LSGEEESVLNVPVALRLFQELSSEQKLLLPHGQNHTGLSKKMDGI